MPLNRHPSRDAAFLVKQRIPDPLHPGKTLAEPGDEILWRPTNGEYPLTVLRRLPGEMAVLIPDTAVELIASYEPASDVPVSPQSDDLPARRGALRLLPRSG